MADSEVRQKFEAWIRSEELPLIAGPLLLQVFAAGMRAGEIAMREKAAQALESRPYYSNQTPDAIRALPLSGAEESVPAAPEEKKA